MAWPIQYTSLAAQGVSAIGPLPSYLAGVRSDGH